MIEVVRTSDDGLRIETWQFQNMSRSFADEVEYVVEFYGIGTKKTKRHKTEFNNSLCYKRLLHRGFNLDISSVPLPDDVIEEVLSKINIKVGFWNV